MFDGLSPKLSPKVEELLNAAKSDLPAAQADAGLIESMTLALSVDALAPSASPRSGSLVGKALTAKTAAMASVLLLSCGVASAATGTLPASAQNAASTAAEHVGLHIPKSDDDESGDDTTTTVEHPDNHGKDVSTVAHDDATEGADHGTAVCTVASDGKCQPANDDNSGQGNSADHRQDGDHPTTSTTVNDDNGGSGNSGNSGNSGSDHPTKDSNPGDSHHGSND